MSQKAYAVLPTGTGTLVVDIFAIDAVHGKGADPATAEILVAGKWIRIEPDPAQLSPDESAYEFVMSSIAYVAHLDANSGQEPADGGV